MAESIYDFEVTRNSGEAETLSAYRDKVVLIVNTASRCGFTYQYEGLEKLNKEYGEKGLVILGFPCNQFGQQEPGDDSEIKSFCDLNYAVSFPLYTKIDVNGDNAHPLYTYLKSEAPGIMGTKSIKWNFTKFLVNKAGKVVKRYPPTTKPEAIEADIQALL